MAVTILSYLHNATTLLFGIYISAAFLGILMNRRKISHSLFFGFFRSRLESSILFPIIFSVHLGQEKYIR